MPDALYTVSVQTWDAVRLGLRAQGYNRAAFFQFACARHGHFRIAVELKNDSFPCPGCQANCPAVFMAYGFTRRPMPFYEQAMKPLPERLRRELYAKEQAVQPVLPEYHFHRPRA